jgi:glycosyltransferase involved in cell wall biosynthesis
LDGGKYGELVRVGDVDAMSEAILRVLSGKMKSASSEWLGQFTREAATEKYLEVLGIGDR